MNFETWSGTLSWLHSSLAPHSSFISTPFSGNPVNECQLDCYKIRFEMPDMEDSMFHSEIEANTKFFSAFFFPYIWQIGPEFSYQYNKTTGLWKKMQIIFQIGTRMRYQVIWQGENNINQNKPMWTHDLAELDCWPKDRRTPWKHFLSCNTVLLPYAFKCPNSLFGFYPKLNRSNMTLLCVAKFSNFPYYDRMDMCNN